MNPDSGMARRVPIGEAKKHFAAGGRVLVSEYGNDRYRVVTTATTTHSKATIAWDELVASVRVWRNRYPNQRYYMIEEQ